MDKYARLRKIGEGAFGKAELVKRKDNGEQYVIKQINISRMGQKEREDSRKEVAVLAQLNHPHIVAYQESFEETGNLYIVMDYCSGGDLYARINNQKGVLFTEEQILDWLVQMCLAIKHIHDRKILHRDIKSQNIFLTSRGEVKIGDFGIAKVLNNTVELARTCIGTPYYLSPEICENKPYNNKSDIWSLGCVVYELSTLKHAFEAGNMKNLVLKIIRGSYPPLSPKYSYELRNLVAQLFKRAPRDRPSINSVLRKPLVSQRIPKFLNSEQLASEFSHTVMHGQKLARALPPPPKPAVRPPSASRNRPEPSVGVPGKRYDPSKIYGQPIRKSKENRSSSDLRKRPGSAGSRPGSAAGSRPGSAAGSRPGSAQDLQKRRQDLQERERKRRQEDIKKMEEKKNQEYNRRHKELQEKQRHARMNKAREEGWKGLIGSLESNGSGDGKQKNDSPRDLVKDPPRAAPKAAGFRGIQPGRNGGGDYNMNAAQKDRGKYEHYNQYLDKLQQDQEQRQRQDNVPPPAPKAAYMGAPRAPRAMPGAPQPAPVWRKAPEPTPVYQPYNQRAQNQQQERAILVDDFVRRRQEAQYNKQRGQAELFGGAAPQNRPPSAGNQYNPAQQERPSSADSRNRDEQEYLDRLRQIRQQNYNERKNMQAKAQMDKNPQLAAEERKKKAEALKKQAEDWAKQRKDVLEQKRQELFAKEKQLKEMRQNGNRPAMPKYKPSPAVPMTGAMNAIGVTPKVVPDAASQAKPPGMTNVLGAIGATPRVVEDNTRPKTPVQKQKDEILKKLNEKGPPQDSEDPPESARSQWGAAKELKIAEQEPERPAWEKGASLDLGKLTLEETGSQMEVTSARDKVILNPASARRQWGKPGDTVLNALQGAALSGTIASTNSEDSVTSPPQSGGETPTKPAVGATITISKSAIQKGTITISKADTNQPQESSPQETSTPNTGSPTSKQELGETANQQTPSEVSANQNAESKPDDHFQFSTIPEVTEESPLDTKTKPETVSPQKPPVPSRKPPVAEKPLVFPKPVLLPKPDAPKEFAPSRPVSVKSEGAGSLFEKVDTDKNEQSTQKTLDTKPEPKVEDVPVVSDIAEEERETPKSGTGLKLGLTMGSFDAPHYELLRTCSEPDLASLFKTLHSNTSMVRVRSLEEMSTVEENEDDSLEAVLSSMERATETAEKEVIAGDEDQGGEDSEGQQELEADEEDEDIADLLSVRETMQSLLLDDSEEDSKRSAIKFSMSSDVESRGDTNDGDIEDTEEDDDTQGQDEEDGVGEEEESDNDEDEGLTDDENKEDDGDEGDQEDDNEKVSRSHSVDNENPQTPEEQRDVMSELFQTDDSDSDGFDDGEDVGDFDLFGRLEESRAELEEALGAEKLIKVYKTVQALQEDEDENMEEGARIAQELLGKEKEHLYPKIFQLVMADAAFTDDNDYDLEDLSSSFSNNLS